MDKTCLCETLVSIDLKMDSATFVGYPVAPGDYVFVYSTEHIADTKFTAIIYYGQCHDKRMGGADLPRGTCIDLTPASESYDLIYDGTYWQLKFGYIEM